MDFSVEIAKVLARRSCKECWGRGYQIVNWCGDKIPIINPYKIVKKKEKTNKNVGEKFENRTYYKIEKVYIPVTGSKNTTEFKTWCSCAQHKVDKMNQELKETSKVSEAKS